MSHGLDSTQRGLRRAAPAAAEQRLARYLVGLIAATSRGSDGGLVTSALWQVLVNALSRPGVVLAEPGPRRITAEGLEVGAALGLRTLLVGVLAIGFVASTSPVRLMTSL